MSFPTNEPYVDFSVLRTLKIVENIRNWLIIFLRYCEYTLLYTVLASYLSRLSVLSDTVLLSYDKEKHYHTKPDFITESEAIYG